MGTKGMPILYTHKCIFNIITPLIRVLSSSLLLKYAFMGVEALLYGGKI